MREPGNRAMRQLGGKIDGDAKRSAVRVFHHEQGRRRRREGHADVQPAGGDEFVHVLHSDSSVLE
jgi:hypothetical protein